MSTAPLIVSTSVLGSTLQILQAAGRAGKECVVLWLGRRSQDAIEVMEVYRPEQVAAEDRFQLPRASIVALLARLGEHELMVAAQVHTHPEEAFHSLADDHWAIVRHVNALSLVLPYFAQATRVDSFFENAAVFRLSPENAWCQVPQADIGVWIRGVS